MSRDVVKAGVGGRGVLRVGVALFVLVLCGAECPPPPWEDPPDAGQEPVGCRVPFAGDPSLPPEMELLVLGGDYRAQVLQDGGSLPMMFPPQGGRVGFVGIRARNIDPCSLKMLGTLRDLGNNQVRLDSRNVTLRVLDGGITASVETSISGWTNIPTCPNQWASTDVFEHPFRLEVSVEERSGRRHDHALTVVPTCAEPEREAECRCMCRLGYRLGDCRGDGGVRDAGRMDAGSTDAGNDGGPGGDGG